MTKTCVACRMEKTTDAFGREKRGDQGRSSRCQPCVVMLRDESKSTIRENRLRRKYGITHAAYEELLKRQQGKCAICQSADCREKSGFWCIDHDHVTGQVRGLLCRMCNVGLGNLQESRLVLAMAVDYLSSPPALNGPPLEIAPPSNGTRVSHRRRVRALLSTRLLNSAQKGGKPIQDSAGQVYVSAQHMADSFGVSAWVARGIVTGEIPNTLGRSFVYIETREIGADRLAADVSPKTGESPTAALLRSTIGRVRGKGGKPIQTADGTVYVSQGHLAKALKIRPQQVSRILTGKRRNTGPVLFKYIEWSQLDMSAVAPIA